MSEKHIVKFDRIGDGMKVTRDPVSGVFNLRAPMPLELDPKSEVEVDLSIVCDHPVHVFQDRVLRQRGLSLVDGIWACQDAKERLRVVLRNDGAGPINVQAGEVVAHCAVLDNSRIELLQT